MTDPRRVSGFPASITTKNRDSITTTSGITIRQREDISRVTWSGWRGGLIPTVMSVETP